MRRSNLTYLLLAAAVLALAACGSGGGDGDGGEATGVVKVTGKSDQ